MASPKAVDPSDDWRLGDAPAAARHGDAPSVYETIQAAEAAVQHWDDTSAAGSFADS